MYEFHFGRCFATLKKLDRIVTDSTDSSTLDTPPSTINIEDPQITSINYAEIKQEGGYKDILDRPMEYIDNLGKNNIGFNQKGGYKITFSKTLGHIENASHPNRDLSINDKNKLIDKAIEILETENKLLTQNLPKTEGVNSTEITILNNDEKVIKYKIEKNKQKITQLNSLRSK